MPGLYSLDFTKLADSAQQPTAKQQDSVTTTNSENSGILDKLNVLAEGIRPLPYNTAFMNKFVTKLRYFRNMRSTNGNEDYNED